MTKQRQASSCDCVTAPVLPGLAPVVSDSLHFDELAARRQVLTQFEIYHSEKCFTARCSPSVCEQGGKLPRVYGIATRNRLAQKRALEQFLGQQI